MTMRHLWHLILTLLVSVQAIELQLDDQGKSYAPEERNIHTTYHSPI